MMSSVDASKANQCCSFSKGTTAYAGNTPRTKLNWGTTMVMQPLSPYFAAPQHRRIKTPSMFTVDHTATNTNDSENRAV